jgi:hypothetical protein
VKYAFAALLVLLAACDRREPVVIDGSSAESFERTAAEARRDLPAADRLVFDRALRSVGGRWHGGGDPDSRARITFHDMTAEQIVADQKAREAR